TLVMRLAALKTAYGSSRMKVVWSSVPDTVSGIPGPAIKGAPGAAKFVSSTSKLATDGVPKLCSCAGGLGWHWHSLLPHPGPAPLGVGSQAPHHSGQSAHWQTHCRTAGRSHSPARSDTPSPTGHTGGPSRRR